MSGWIFPASSQARDAASVHNHHLSYQEAEQRLGVARPSLHLAKSRLRWIGHALRSEDTVLTEVLTFVPAGLSLIHI